MSKGKILVADDTATYRAVLGDGLADRGYEVIYASDGLQAAQIIKEELPNLKLVVLDLLMPKMLGFDVLKQIREMEGGQKLPVMVISGLFKTIDDIKKVKELGASGFIDKAQPIDEVIFRIDHFLHPDAEQKKEVTLVPASILVTYREGDKPFSAYSFTVSPKGVFLRTTNPSPVGAELRMRFTLEEDARVIETSAKVTNVVTSRDRESLLKSPLGMAVEFTSLSASDQAYISQWVEKTAEEKDMIVIADAEG